MAYERNGRDENASAATVGVWRLSSRSGGGDRVSDGYVDAGTGGSRGESKKLESRLVERTVEGVRGIAMFLTCVSSCQRCKSRTLICTHGGRAFWFRGVGWCGDVVRGWVGGVERCGEW
ncbi:hypothetical protein Tco_0668218 [Tanacetum coccineum]